jgi:hypothetical protein
MTFLLLAIILGIFLLPVTAVVLPLMLVFWVGFTVLRLILRLVIGALLLPILAVVVGVGVLVAGLGLALAVLVPLAPLVLAALLIWTVVKLVNRPARTAF